MTSFYFLFSIRKGRICMLHLLHYHTLIVKRLKALGMTEIRDDDLRQPKINYLCFIFIKVQDFDNLECTVHLIYDSIPY